MTRFLLAVDSVHTAAAACDYLEGRLGEGDAVTALAVTEADAGGTARDGGDALNVASVRLSAATTVETERTEGDAAGAILEHAADGGADEIVIGARSGEPGADAPLGRTAGAVIVGASVPVVVLPVPRLD